MYSLGLPSHSAHGQVHKNERLFPATSVQVELKALVFPPSPRLLSSPPTPVSKCSNRMLFTTSLPPPPFHVLCSFTPMFCHFPHISADYTLIISSSPCCPPLCLVMPSTYIMTNTGSFLYLRITVKETAITKTIFCGCCYGGHCV